MGLYEGIKEIAKIVQQADNLDLYRQLLDLSNQALDLQSEIKRLTDENEELKRQKILESDIEYHVDPVITRKSDTKEIKYCAACWGDKGKLIPIQTWSGNERRCPLCHVRIFEWN